MVSVSTVTGPGLLVQPCGEGRASPGSPLHPGSSVLGSSVRNLGESLGMSLRSASDYMENKTLIMMCQSQS